MTLKAKLLKAMIEAGHSILPMSYCPDGYYTDYDDWAPLEIDEGEFALNFYSDGEKFFFTAYPDVKQEDGTYSIDYDTMIHVLVVPVEQV